MFLIVLPYSHISSQKEMKDANVRASARENDNDNDNENENEGKTGGYPIKFSEVIGKPGIMGHPRLWIGVGPF